MSVVLREAVHLYMVFHDLNFDTGFNLGLLSINIAYSRTRDCGCSIIYNSAPGARSGLMLLQCQGSEASRTVCRPSKLRGID